jgi:LETM1 and EF-hand domain-containing protein 1, mitochondrial
MSIWFPRRSLASSKAYYTTSNRLLDTDTIRISLSRSSKYTRRSGYSSLSPQFKRQRNELQRAHRILAPSLIQLRTISYSPHPNEEKQLSASAGSEKSVAKPSEQQALRTRVWNKVKHEALHFYHGSKLLAAEVRISSRLLLKVMRGGNLTRRENRQVFKNIK